MMKPSADKRAINTGILGGIALLLASVPGGSLRWLGLFLGVLALWRGIVALTRAARSAVPTPKRTVLLSLLGGCLGCLAIVLGLSLSNRRSYNNAQRQRWQQTEFSQSPEPGSQTPRAESSATDFNSNLPIIVLRADGLDIPSHRQALMQAQFFEVDPTTLRASLSATASHEGQVSLHVRGSSTQRLPKSSYTLHTVENRTNQVKVPLLGLPKEEDWVLYAPFEDKTLIRDVLAFELARRSGHYAPRTRFVELFITRSPGRLSMSDYAGVYVLMEKIKRGPNRVNIAKLDRQANQAPDITGGYIVKRDHKERGEPQFSTSHGGPYFFVYPDSRKITPEQRRWLANHFNEFESVLYGPDFADPQSGYNAYLDVPSFIDAHWLIEMSKNVDGFRYSAFITKDREGKLKTEPPWDWNRSFGNANYYGGWQPNGWYWTRLRLNEISWYQRLREDPEFVRRCNARWAELRRDAFEPQKILQLVDSLTAQLGEAKDRNFRRWPILGQQVTCNHFVGDTYEEEVAWMKNWIVRRVAWIDRQTGVDRNSNPQSVEPGPEE